MDSHPTTPLKPNTHKIKFLDWDSKEFDKLLNMVEQEQESEKEAIWT